MVKFSVVYGCDNISNIFRKAGKADQETEGYYKKKIGWVKVVNCGQDKQGKIKDPKTDQGLLPMGAKTKGEPNPNRKRKIFGGLKEY